MSLTYKVKIKAPPPSYMVEAGVTYIVILRCLGEDEVCRVKIPLKMVFEGSRDNESRFSHQACGIRHIIFFKTKKNGKVIKCNGSEGKMKFSNEEYSNFESQVIPQLTKLMENEEYKNVIATIYAIHILGKMEFSDK